MTTHNYSDALLRRPWDGGRFLAAQISNLLYRRFPTCGRCQLLFAVLALAASSLYAAEFTVHMNNFSFAPKEQTVNVGDTVTWVNQDPVQHDTTSGLNGVPSGLWHSPLLSQSGSFSFTFNVAAGRYDYYCTPHQRLGMVGAITVVAPPPTNIPPTVSLQSPAEGATFAPGDTVTIQAAAADSDGTVAHVDFSVNGNALSSGTTAPYTASFAPSAAGQYAISAVAVDNQGASSAPATVNITVIVPTLQPTIITPPQSQSVQPGAFVTLSVVASGTPPLSYQWLFNSNAISGQTQSSLTLFATTPAQAGSYAVIVSNSAGSVTSSAAVVTVTQSTNLPPLVAIVSPRSNATFTAGSTITVQANASARSGILTNVQFFNGAISVGSFTNPPYQITLSIQTQGSYTLTAVAADSLGQKTTSAPVKITITPKPSETTPPTIRVTQAPPNFTRLSSPVVFLAGTAADNLGLDHVEFQVNGGAFQRATGTTSWRANVPLIPGNDIVLIRSVDQAGNTSQPVTRYYTFVSVAHLHLHIIGEGRITPPLDSRVLQEGQTYSVTAVPASGYVFAGWSGGVQSAYPQLSFTMQPDFELVATFVPNPFPPVAGGYRGTFLTPAGTAPVESGTIQLQLTKLGAATGKLVLHGASFSFRAQFDGNGHIQAPVLRRGQTPLTLDLQILFNSQQIQGTVSDLTWTADLLAGKQ